MIEVFGSLLVLVLVLLVVGSLAYGALSAAPWVPLRSRDVARLIEFCQPQPGEVLVDLGCGDGRIITTAARRYGLKSVGYEVALVPYFLAQLRILWSGTRGRARVHLKSFWGVDLSSADIVVCFLTPSAMARLAPKLEREIKPGARFATYAFSLPGRAPSGVSKPNPSDVSVYLYTN
ncbi:MAG: class I SAM-dependent methyltransferase [Candidatus Veblenbacteria bacterium]|nr:class I SAM-dependent methyltransferase [Candidatus Veblenbacteria bacterium]MDZ4230081.1 class I SAM-dependent methyltransferase [Candidatus Veblenbacteria bacterium]